MMQTPDSALGLVKGKPTERWRRKVSGLTSLGLYDSGTAEIQSFHRTVSAHVVRASRQRLEGEQVMHAYDPNVVSPHACRACRGGTCSAAPSARAGGAGIWHTREARTASLVSPG